MIRFNYFYEWMTPRVSKMVQNYLIRIIFSKYSFIIHILIIFIVIIRTFDGISTRDLFAETNYPGLPTDANEIIESIPDEYKKDLNHSNYHYLNAHVSDDDCECCCLMVGYNSNNIKRYLNVTEDGLEIIKVHLVHHHCYCSCQEHLSCYCECDPHRNGKLPDCRCNCKVISIVSE